MAPILTAFAFPGPAIYGGTDGYIGAVEFHADALNADFHYWNFQDGTDRHGPFQDWGNTTPAITLTAASTPAVFGFQHCGPVGPPYVGGVIARNLRLPTTAADASRINGSSMPAFTSPGALGFFARRGIQDEKHLMLAQVQNTGSTTFYRTRLKILNDGKLQLTIEIPGSSNNVVIETDAAVWPASERMDWKFITIRQPNDNSGVQILVNATSVAVTRTYNGSATANTWIDDMLAWGGRNSANDVFRLFGDENTGTAVDDYAQTGIGGFWIYENGSPDDAAVSDIYTNANTGGSATEFHEGVLATLTEKPVWWLYNHPVNSGGHQPNEARAGKEQNQIQSLGTTLPTDLREAPIEKGARQYASYAGTTGALAFFADRYSGQDSGGVADWQDWVYTEGALIFRANVPSLVSGSNLRGIFAWGQEPTGGPALQEGITVWAFQSSSGYTNGIRVAFYARTSSALVWWRDFDANLTSGDPHTFVISQPADGGGPKLWVDGVEITTSSDVTNTTPAVVGPNSWFSEISTRAGGPGGINCFRVGQYINASGFGPWNAPFETFIITDQVLVQADADAIETAIAAGIAYTPSADSFTVTMGASGLAGSELRGFDTDTSFGSVSGAPDFLTGGDSVTEMYWTNVTDQFVFSVTGTYAQDSFKRLVFETPYGYHALASNTATFTQSGGRSIWTFPESTKEWSDYVASDTAVVYVITD